MDQYGSATVEARVIETRRDSEAMVFEIPLGLLKIVCIVNIPPEGEEKAPAYLRFMPGDLLNNLTKGPRGRRTGPIKAPKRVEVIRQTKGRIA